mmetsp:Transcript_48258/g.120817  ORF Transcript_48258/g.120817 Transcript_48258/m.120817 type:complete len:184 (-) Transcript_48258:30-581(-)
MGQIYVKLESALQKVTAGELAADERPDVYRISGTMAATLVAFHIDGSTGGIIPDRRDRFVTAMRREGHDQEMETEAEDQNQMGGGRHLGWRREAHFILFGVLCLTVFYHFWDRHRAWALTFLLLGNAALGIGRVYTNLAKCISGCVAGTLWHWTRAEAFCVKTMWHVGCGSGMAEEEAAEESA